MNKVLLIIILSIFSFSIQAQSFLKEGNQWIIEAYDLWNSLPSTTNHSIEYITVGKDTLINGIVYKKLNITETSPCTIYKDPEFLREDGAKVYRLNDDLTEEFLFYDFEEIVSFQIPYESGWVGNGIGTAIIDSFGIETTYNNKQIEVQYMHILDNGSNPDDFVYKAYKDVGFGLIFPGLGTGLCDPIDVHKLKCHVSGTDTLQFTEFPCEEFIVSNKNIRLEEINIYPNPTNGFVHLPEGYRLDNIIDVYGNIKSGNLTKNVLDLNTFPNGVYTLFLKKGKQAFFTKIVKI